mgnify:CR=1 FL=1
MVNLHISRSKFVLPSVLVFLLAKLIWQLWKQVPRLKKNKPEYVEGVQANAQWTFPLLVRRVA